MLIFIIQINSENKHRNHKVKEEKIALLPPATALYRPDVKPSTFPNFAPKPITSIVDKGKNRKFRMELPTATKESEENCLGTV